jgi:hypothetical protein
MVLLVFDPERLEVEADMGAVGHMLRHHGDKVRGRGGGG